MEIWKSDPINSFKSLLRNLDNDYVEFDTNTQKWINKSFTSSLKDDKIITTIEIKDEHDQLQELPSGREKIKDDGDKSEKLESDNNDETPEKDDIKISFTKDVLPYIIPLACILTIKNTNKDFVKMLNDIQENPELLDIFDDSCLRWWNKKDLINIIKNIVLKYFDKNSNTYNISINFKMSLQSLIDSQKELLELINECLKPKEIEKKRLGEVYTPMSFINDYMLKDLELYYKKRYNKNIFEDEHLKWGDTTVGMGNFMVAIYYKLMDGLKNKIPNEKDRKKHIIENMLFMAEYNKKNCFVIKQIFNINNEYKLNLYEGDSLQLDIQKEFGLKKFDIIIGNPPYNEEFKGLNGYAPALYNKFTEYYIEKCDLLYFVIPSRWFSGGRGLDKFRKMMLSRSDIVYIKHFDDARKIFGNTVDIKGGVNYFLKDIGYKGQCCYNGVMLKLDDCDILIESKYLPLITKINEFPRLNNNYRSKGYYEIPLTDTRLHDDYTDDDIKCYVSQMKGSIKYIKKNTIKDNKFGKWQIITPSASYGAFSGFGNLILGNPNEVYSETYISFAVDTEQEAQSLLSYMKCRLPNMLLSLRKISQNISSDTCKWIPLPPLNKEWTDEEVYKYFKMSVDDIKLINETNISGYKNSVNQITTIIEPKIINTETEIDTIPTIKKIRFLKLKKNVINDEDKK